MDTTILQIPLKKDLRDRAFIAAQNLGFSSLQETVRIFLNRLAIGKIDISFNEQTVLSEKAVKRYDKMIEDIESGKIKTKSFTNVNSLIEYLNK